MMISRRLPTPFIFAAGILVATILACHFEAREAATITYEQYYSIDPSSLLMSIDQNGDAPFTPIENEPELPPPAQQIPVNWKQADYMRIANALFENVWGETTDGWLLKSMSFSLGCTKIKNGFQDAHFRYFRNDKTQQQEIRIERSIYIDPRRNSIRVLEYIYSPRLVDWGFVDLSQLQFSADDVLALAESNGGKEKRLAVNNECNITLLLSPDSASYRGWDVTYTRSGGFTSLFRSQIDPITGEIDNQ